MENIEAIQKKLETFECSDIANNNQVKMKHSAS